MKRWSAVYYILFQHLWDVKHIRNFPQTTAKVIKTFHRLSVRAGDKNHVQSLQIVSFK